MNNSRASKEGTESGFRHIETNPDRRRGNAAEQERTTRTSRSPMSGPNERGEKRNREI